MRVGDVSTRQSRASPDCTIGFPTRSPDAFLNGGGWVEVLTPSLPFGAAPSSVRHEPLWCVDGVRLAAMIYILVHPPSTSLGLGVRAGGASSPRCSSPASPSSRGLIDLGPGSGRLVCRYASCPRECRMGDAGCVLAPAYLCDAACRGVRTADS